MKNLEQMQAAMRTRSEEAMPGAALRQRIKAVSAKLWTTAKRPWGLYAAVAKQVGCSREYVRQTLSN